ncbi:unnamed protein product [Lupinus luteus]|uniref:Uncharacterized protein n=1 Tax=Lupinus luteus TaxID=3873 RepID=A0AAV1WP30_LUPLU
MNFEGIARGFKGNIPLEDDIMAHSIKNVKTGQEANEDETDMELVDGSLEKV